MLRSDLRSGKSPEDLVDSAVREEPDVRELGPGAARATDDRAGRGMFRMLAHMAYRHGLILAQEKDLLVGCPDDRRPGKTRWRTEKSPAR